MGKNQTKKESDYYIFESCPYCGSDDVEPSRTKPATKAIPRIFWVNCNSCGATGPDTKTMEEAIEKWDERYS